MVTICDKLPTTQAITWFEMTVQTKHKYTLEEYFALERDSEEKFEYWDGNVWTMSGATINHNRIVRNITRRLDEQFALRGCEVFPSNFRVYVPNYAPYRYPDLSALCGKPDIRMMGGLELLINPQLIVEVLSDSTEGFDRGDKFTYYKSIPSFCEYLLISQRRPHVSQFVKQSDTIWTQTEFNDIEDAVELKFASCRLNLNEIYRDVTFEPILKITERGDESTNAF
jgi:Uma2 family endonuclease